MVWRKSLKRLDPLWEFGSPAIWRTAAAIQTPKFFRWKCASRFTTATPPIATKVYSHRVRHGLVGAASCEKEQRRDTFFQLAANHLQFKACERIAQAFNPNELCEIPVAQNIQYTRYHRGYLLAY
jgi:hypothetical protein